MQNSPRCVLLLICLTLAHLWDVAAAAAAAGFPRYDHIVLIIEENHGYKDIIGNKFAPNINRLARDYGLATHSFSTADPSAPNYVAMLGGSDFGIADDNGYYLHTLDSPSLATQLDHAGLIWRAYLQGYPYPATVACAILAVVPASRISIPSIPRSTTASCISGRSRKAKMAGKAS